jgi:hypothetical protein
MAVVLVTEDEPIVTAFARRIGLEADHEALEAASVEEGLGIIACERDRDPFHRHQSPPNAA